jgi:hypothetical protein
MPLCDGLPKVCHILGKGVHAAGQPGAAKGLMCRPHKDKVPHGGVSGII